MSALSQAAEDYLDRVMAAWLFQVVARLSAKALRLEARHRQAKAIAAEVLNEHAPSPRQRSLPFIAMFEAPKGALSVAEAERRLEDGEDESFGR